MTRRVLGPTTILKTVNLGQEIHLQTKYPRWCPVCFCTIFLDSVLQIAGYKRDEFSIPPQLHSQGVRSSSSHLDSSCTGLSEFLSAGGGGRGNDGDQKTGAVDFPPLRASRPRR